MEQAQTYTQEDGEELRCFWGDGYWLGDALVPACKRT